MYKNNDTCPICGIGVLAKKIIQETFEYKGSYRTVENYVVYECSECEESLVEPKTMKETEKIIRDFQREVDGLLTSEDIKEIRTSLGYTQEEFGRILGGGVKGFARYENGTVTQSKPMDNLLRIIKNIPNVIEILTTGPENISRQPIARRAQITSDAQDDGIIFGNPIPASSEDQYQTAETT